MAQLIAPSAKFKDLTIGNKILFSGKLVAFLLSFGFAYPTLLSD
jgi:hypothetical protein